MADFTIASCYSSNNLSVGTLVDLVDGLPVKWSVPSEVNNSSSPITTVSSSSTSIASFTVALESDEVIQVTGRLIYSMNSSTTVGALHIYNSTNSTQIYPDSIFMHSDNSAAGQSGTQFTFGWDGSRSGSTTYQLRWRRVTGSGTIYSAYCQLNYAIHKQRS